MKLLVASDIHGSAYYCQQLINRINEECPDKIILLGDILYHGPRNDLPKDYNPKKVIPMLNGLKDRLICVRGNCDSEVDQMVLEFPIMADYSMVNICGKNIYLSHGHIYNEQRIMPGIDGGILICGHTHIPKCTSYENFVFMNPGSVSIPKDGSAHTYMVIDEGKCIWKDVENAKRTDLEYTFN